MAFWTTVGLTLAGLTIEFSRWVSQLILIAVDPNRGDMLVMINAALDRLSTGQDPYFVYHIPVGTAAPLRAVAVDVVPDSSCASCGHADDDGLRAALRAGPHGDRRGIRRSVRRPCTRGAPAAPARGRSSSSPLFDQFILIGHTPAYWPLLAAFALLCSAGAHKSAAVLLGMLIVARSLMVAGVPVFLIYLWYADRKVVVRAAGLLGAVVTVSFAPFAVWDWRTLLQGLYGNYIRIMTGFVWTQTNWMDSTLGLTRCCWRLATRARRSLPGPRARVCLRACLEGAPCRAAPGSVVLSRVAGVLHDHDLARVVHLPRRLPAGHLLSSCRRDAGLSGIALANRLRHGRGRRRCAMSVGLAWYPGAYTTRWSLAGRPGGTSGAASVRMLWKRLGLRLGDAPGRSHAAASRPSHRRRDSD